MTGRRLFNPDPTATAGGTARRRRWLRVKPPDPLIARRSIDAPIPTPLDFRLKEHRLRAGSQSHVCLIRSPNRTVDDQYHPHAVDGCRAGGQERPSGHADGSGPGGLYVVARMCCGSIPTLRIGRGAIDSCCRAVMLRCCFIRVLHLAGVKQLGPDGKPTGELACPIDQIKQFRQLHSRCPGHPGSARHDGRRNDDRPARPRLRQQRRHGDRPALAGRPFRSAGVRAVRLQHLRSVQRRRHDGRNLERSRVDRGAS